MKTKQFIVYNYVLGTYVPAINVDNTNKKMSQM